MQIKAALVDAVRNRQAVLFAGAGISWKAIGFGGAYIRDQLGMQIKRDYPDYDYGARSLEDVCDEYVALNDQITLVDRLAALVPQDREPQESHLAAVKAFRFIVTTNWDLLFEAAYRKINQHYQVLSQDADAPMFNYDQHNLLKIHGSGDRPLSLVATTDDYENYAETHAKLLDRVAELLPEQHRPVRRLRAARRACAAPAVADSWQATTVDAQGVRRRLFRRGADEAPGEPADRGHPRRCRRVPQRACRPVWRHLSRRPSQCGRFGRTRNGAPETVTVY